MTTTQYVGLVDPSRLKQFARDYHVHVMVIAHPAKMQKDEGSATTRSPRHMTLAIPRHWYNKPEQVIVVHRQNGKTLIRIAKSRYHYWLGKPGDIELTFDEYNLSFA